MKNWCPLTSISTSQTVLLKENAGVNNMYKYNSKYWHSNITKETKKKKRKKKKERQQQKKKKKKKKNSAEGKKN